MEEELTCCVCLELYEEPILLPCSHNLCKKCLRDLISWSGTPRLSFNCPKCRKTIRLDHWNGIDSLPPNRALANIVAIYKEGSDSGAKLRCLKHRGERAASLYCRSCSKFVCEQCLKETHNGFGHVVKDISDFVQDEQIKVTESILELESFIEQEKVHRDRIQHFLKDIESQQSSQLVMAEKQVQQLTQAILIKQQQFQARLGKESRQLRQPLDVQLDKTSMSLTQAQQLMDTYLDSQTIRNKERQLKSLVSLGVKLNSFLTFKSAGAGAQADGTSLKQYSISNVDHIMKAIRNMSWEPLPDEQPEANKLGQVMKSQGSINTDLHHGACSSLPNLQDLSLEVKTLSGQSKSCDGDSLGATSSTSGGSQSEEASNNQSPSAITFLLGRPMKFDFSFKANPTDSCRGTGLKKARAVRRLHSVPSGTGTATAAVSSLVSIPSEWYQADEEKRAPRSPKHVRK